MTGSENPGTEQLTSNSDQQKEQEVETPGDDKQEEPAKEQEEPAKEQENQPASEPVSFLHFSSLYDIISVYIL